MKPVYSDEVARHLGYQKYWPEKLDWALAIGGTLLFIVAFFAIALFVADKTGYTARQEQKINIYKNTVSEWCKTTLVKNLAETKECLNY